ncbi:MAG: 4'-phosphopantetheinyl transferase family protein [Longimicrobiales bacterium]
MLPRPLVQVWLVDLDEAAFPAHWLTQLLAPDEQLRAARFRFERDRQRYVVGRGMLRVLLGVYLGESPDQLKLVQGASGKPFLQSKSNRQPLHFNLAHAGGRAAFAFTYTAELGIDLENVRPVEEMQNIADRYFSSPEAETLRSFPEPQRAGAFFRVWTRKEAVVKAIGEGLGRPFDHFAVPCATDSPLEVRWLVDDPISAGDWSLCHFDPGPGFVGAVAVQCANARLEVLRLGATELNWDLMRASQPAGARYASQH